MERASNNSYESSSTFSNTEPSYSSYTSSLSSSNFSSEPSTPPIPIIKSSSHSFIRTQSNLSHSFPVSSKSFSLDSSNSSPCTSRISVRPKSYTVSSNSSPCALTRSGRPKSSTASSNSSPFTQTRLVRPNSFIEPSISSPYTLSRSVRPKSFIESAKSPPCSLTQSIGPKSFLEYSNSSPCTLTRPLRPVSPLVSSPSCASFKSDRPHSYHGFNPQHTYLPAMKRNYTENSFLDLKAQNQDKIFGNVSYKSKPSIKSSIGTSITKLDKLSKECEYLDKDLSKILDKERKILGRKRIRKLVPGLNNKLVQYEAKKLNKLNSSASQDIERANRAYNEAQETVNSMNEILKTVENDVVLRARRLYIGSKISFSKLNSHAVHRIRSSQYSSYHEIQEMEEDGNNVEDDVDEGLYMHTLDMVRILEQDLNQLGFACEVQLKRREPVPEHHTVLHGQDGQAGPTPVVECS